MRSREDAERLFREHLTLVRIVAKRTWQKLGKSIPIEELISFGNEGLFNAALEHDDARSRFQTHAQKRIEWAMLDGARRTTGHRSLRRRAFALWTSFLVREASEEAAPDEPRGIHPEEVYAERFDALLQERAGALAVGFALAAEPPAAASEEATSPEDRALRVELYRIVKEGIAQLDDRERALIERHYWGNERFDVIAAELGLSKSRASRLHAAAIQRLSDHIAES